MPSISVRTMTTADIPFGMQLKTSAGWNQLEADWQRVLDFSPTGCFIGILDGTPVGTVASTRFGDVAWISMMLVSDAARGQGVGKALMTAALDHLERVGVATVRLDATPLGRPLYEKLGFELEFEGARFAGVPRVVVDKSEDEVSPLTLTQLNLAAELDRQITGTDRLLLLRRLFADENEQAWCVQQGEKLLGFQMKRRGAKATPHWPVYCARRDGKCFVTGRFAATFARKCLRGCSVTKLGGVPVVTRCRFGIAAASVSHDAGPRIAGKTRSYLGEFWAGEGVDYVGQVFQPVRAILFT